MAEKETLVTGVREVLSDDFMDRYCISTRRAMGRYSGSVFVPNIMKNHRRIPLEIENESDLAKYEDLFYAMQYELIPLHYIKTAELLSKDFMNKNDKKAILQIVKMSISEGEPFLDFNATVKGYSADYKNVRSFKPLIHMAVEHGHIDVLKEMLKASPSLDLNKKDESGLTPMHLAILHGSADAIIALKKAGAKNDVLDNNGNTYSELLKKKIESDRAAGKDVSKLENVLNLLKPTPDELSSLLVNLSAKKKGELSQAEHKRIAELMNMKHPSEIDLNARDWQKSTALHYAAKYGYTERVQALIGAGVDVSAKNIWGQTPLHEAAAGGYTKSVNALLAAGADVYAWDYNRPTPLSLAVEKNCVDIVKSLVKAGAWYGLSHDYLVKNPEIMRTPDKDGNTLLEKAAFEGDVARLIDYQEAGADLSAVDEETGATLLHMAAVGGQEGTVGWLLAQENGPKKDVKTKPEAGGRTALDSVFHAMGKKGISRAEKEKLKAVAEQLIKAGVPCNEETRAKINYDPLKETEKLLGREEKLSKNEMITVMSDLKNEWDNAKGDEKARVERLIDQAVARAHTDAPEAVENAKVLFGEDYERIVGDPTKVEPKVAVKDTTVKSSARKSVERKSPSSRSKADKMGLELISLLRDSHYLDYDRITKLIRMGRSEINLNVKDEKGMTALHYAASYGKAGIVKRLLRFGAKTNVKNKDGLTPYDLCPLSMPNELRRMLRPAPQRTPWSGGYSRTTNAFPVGEEADQKNMTEKSMLDVALTALKDKNLDEKKKNALVQTAILLVQNGAEVNKEQLQEILKDPSLRGMFEQSDMGKALVAKVSEPQEQSNASLALRSVSTEVDAKESTSVRSEREGRV